MKNLGKNIRKLRTANGWTQTELAQKLGVTQKVITTYENNQRVPTLDKLKKLAVIFDTSMDKLSGDEEIEIKETIPHLHRNSRTAKIQDLFDRLPPLEQRSFLKQVTAMVEKYGR
jgi:transcriptional regulator with XRE-family HTH domain